MVSAADRRIGAIVPEQPQDIFHDAIRKSVELQALALRRLQNFFPNQPGQVPPQQQLTAADIKRLTGG